MDTDAESEVSWFWLTRSGVWLLAEDALLLTRPLVVMELYLSLLDWMLEDTIVAVKMSRGAIGSQSVRYKIVEVEVQKQRAGAAVVRIPALGWREVRVGPDEYSCSV